MHRSYLSFNPKDGISVATLRVDGTARNSTFADVSCADNTLRTGSQPTMVRIALGEMFRRTTSASARHVSQLMSVNRRVVTMI